VSGRMRLRDDALEWRAVQGEVVAVDLRRAAYLAVNQSGATLWPLLAEGVERADLVRALADKFSLGEQDAEADVDAFLSVLREHDLIVDEDGEIAAR
jgi:Coenzyme PQQ synthesis protein D (PqqD)